FREHPAWTRPGLGHSGVRAALVRSFGVFGLDSRTHGHEPTLGARNRALDQELLTRFVDAEDVKVLRGLGTVAQVARHALAGEHTTWVLCHTDRAGDVVRTAVTVRCALRGHVVTLDRAGIAFTDRSALHVDLLAHGKHVRHGHCGTG